FRAQLRQIHPVAVATMGISKLRKLFRHLLPLWPWPPPVPGGGDFFVASHDELRQISDVANCNT
ncbi:TPA: hypothetical protein ACHK7S_004981, partial [Escherichia coli]